MSNIYKGLGLVYFQMEDSFALGDYSKLPNLSGNSLKLYTVILCMAQRKSTPVVKLTTEEIRKFTGMGINAVTQAAGQLHAERLVCLTQRKGHNWGFTFELLDVQTGLPVVHRRDKEAALSLATLTKSQQKNYAIRRLGEAFDHFDQNGIRAHCMFHQQVKPTPTLSIGLSDGRGFTFKCFNEDCRYSEGGGMLEFETAHTQAVSGRTINSATAWERIAYIIRATDREEYLKAQSIDEALETMT